MSALRPPRRRLLAALACLAVLVAACGTESGEVSATSGAAADGGSVVVTTTVLGDVVRAVVGDAAEVTTLMPAGADPHTFEPSARQRAAVQDADLVVMNGGGLEASLEGPVEEAEAAGVPVLRAVDHVDTIAAGSGGADAGADEGGAGTDHGDEQHADEQHEAEEGDEHDHEGGVDPHIWLDPSRMALVVEAVSDALVDVVAEPEAVLDRAATYGEELLALDGAVRERLAAVPDERRTLVTNHDAFAYFADAYDFRVVGTIIPSVSTGAEPSAQDLERLAATVEREGVRAIFTEATASPRLAETLAEEVGGDVAVVQLVTGSLDDAVDSYEELMRTNADRVAEALGDPGGG